MYRSKRDEKGQRKFPLYLTHNELIKSRSKWKKSQRKIRDTILVADFPRKVINILGILLNNLCSFSVQPAGVG